MIVTYCKLSQGQGTPYHEHGPVTPYSLECSHRSHSVDFLLHARKKISLVCSSDVNFMFSLCMGTKLSLIGHSLSLLQDWMRLLTPDKKMSPMDSSCPYTVRTGLIVLFAVKQPPDLFNTFIIQSIIIIASCVGWSTVLSGK